MLNPSAIGMGPGDTNANLAFSAEPSPVGLNGMPRVPCPVHHRASPKGRRVLSLFSGQLGLVEAVAGSAERPPTGD